MLESVNLAEQQDDRAGSLSHGEKQWLEIAMLLVQGRGCCCSTSRSPA